MSYEMLMKGTFQLLLGPEAQSRMLPSSAKIVEGVPTRVRVRIVGEVGLEGDFIRVECQGQRCVLHQQLVRLISDDERTPLWQNPLY